MKLIETPDNPAPEGAKAGYVRTADNMKIRYARWAATGRPIKGTVILLHGRAEYVEKLFETVGDLIKRGFDVVTFDWRGQGGSDRLLEDPRRGYVDSFDQYVIDLEAIMNDVVLPDCSSPFYVLAHSTGSLVALLAAPEMGNRIRRMVLSTPLLGLRGLPMNQSALKLVTGAMSAFGLGEVYMSGGATPDESRPFRGNKLTSDTRRFERNARIANEHREISIGGPTAGWLFAAIQAIETVHDPDFHSQITIPTLLVQAGSDQVVANAAIEDLSRRLRSGSSVSIVGAKHELMQERDVYRQQLLAAFDAFVPGTEILG